VYQSLCRWGSILAGLTASLHCLLQMVGNDLACRHTIPDTRLCHHDLQAVADFFGKDPSRTLNAKECVSRGAALQCAMLSPIFRYAGMAIQHRQYCSQLPWLHHASSVKPCAQTLKLLLSYIAVLQGA
jgi:Hsp70 protein